MTECVVQGVSDGDSFRCKDGSRVRLIGVDSPERQQHPFGDQAQQALLEIMPAGSSVRLEPDVAPIDRYGRVLAYAWLGPTLVNEAMVQGGWAVLYTVPPNVKYADRLERAQKEARARGAGLWAGPGVRLSCRRISAGEMRQLTLMVFIIPCARCILPSLASGMKQISP